MQVGGVYYCNLCSLEIPEGEEPNEFNTALLPEPGHCHSEHLSQKNAILRQYGEAARTLGALLNPALASAPKTSQAMAVQEARTVSLRQIPKVRRA